jgi:hypothetical protein
LKVANSGGRLSQVLEHVSFIVLASLAMNMDDVAAYKTRTTQMLMAVPVRILINKEVLRNWSQEEIYQVIICTAPITSTRTI